MFWLNDELGGSVRTGHRRANALTKWSLLYSDVNDPSHSRERPAQFGSGPPGGPLADKKAAKLRRRQNKDDRQREKAERTGESAAQRAEAIRQRAAGAELENAERRVGLDGSVGGDTAPGRRA